MHRAISVTTCGLALLVTCAMSSASGVAQERRAGVQQIDLAERLATGAVTVVNRDVTPLQDPRGIHLSERQGNGIAWIQGTEFTRGTIEVDVRGRDLLQRSFVGIAFHRRDDNTYEGVYLRPFNFRASDPVRHMHAVQYIALPDHDWDRLRKEFPEEFENPVDPSIAPTAWVPLRVVVNERNVQVFVGKVTSPTLEVRRLGVHSAGMVGLWAGNGSDGDFANLRLTPAK